MASGRLYFMFGIKNLASAGVCRSGASQVRILRRMPENNKESSRLLLKWR